MPILDLNKRFRRYVFTLHQNLPDQKISGSDLLARVSSLSYFKYVIFQLETTSTGTLHYQGYVQFNVAKRVREISADFLRATFDYPLGAYEDNWRYCTKKFAEKDEDGFYTKGRSVLVPNLDCGPWFTGKPTLSNRKGGRPSKHDESDKKIVELIEKKTPVAEIIRQCPNAYRYHKIIREVELVLSPLVDLGIPPTSVWFAGISSSGKTTYAEWYVYDKMGHPKEKVYRTNASTKSNPATWFEDSAAEMDVLFLEEVRLGYPETYDFLKVLSGTSPLSVKGSLVRSQFKYIYITGIKTPEKTYRPLSLYHDRYQLMRRIDHVFCVMKDRKLLSKLKLENNYSKLPTPEWRKLYRPLVYEDTLHHRKVQDELELKMSPPELEIAEKTGAFHRHSRLTNPDQNLLSVLKAEIIEWFLSSERPAEKEELIRYQRVYNAERTEIASKKKLFSSLSSSDNNEEEKKEYWTSPDDFPHFSLVGIVPDYLLARSTYVPAFYPLSTIVLSSHSSYLSANVLLHASNCQCEICSLPDPKSWIIC